MSELNAQDVATKKLQRIIFGFDETKEEIAAERDWLWKNVEQAIGILDGNEPVIDWRAKNNSELLRKLCEHLEAYEEIINKNRI